MRAGRAVAVVGAALVVCACSGGSQPSAAGAQPGTQAASAGPVPTSSQAVTPTTSATDPRAGLPTGTALKAMLAPASWFPAGFKPVTGAAIDSGDVGQPAIPPDRMPCTGLNATGWVDLAGIANVSSAQNAYYNTKLGEYAEEIDVYPASDAQQVMSKLRALPRRCPSFHDSQAGGSITTSPITAPALGDDRLGLRLRNPRWGADTTLLAVRVGQAVITVQFSAVHGTSQAQAARLATQITHTVTAAS